MSNDSEYPNAQQAISDRLHSRRRFMGETAAVGAVLLGGAFSGQRALATYVHEPFNDKNPTLAQLLAASKGRDVTPEEIQAIGDMRMEEVRELLSQFKNGIEKLVDSQERSDYYSRAAIISTVVALMGAGIGAGTGAFISRGEENIAWEWLSPRERKAFEYIAEKIVNGERENSKLPHVKGEHAAIMDYARVMAVKVKGDAVLRDNIVKEYERDKLFGSSIAL